MADTYERFSERARRVLTYSQEEAHRFNHNYIGTEHILLGLVREADGVAARVLASMGIDPPRVRQAIEYIIGRGASPLGGEIGLTPRAKRVIELAIDEARRLNHHYVGTEHLLLGLAEEGEGIAAGVLESMGASPQRVRQAVLQVVRQDIVPDDIEQRPRPEQQVVFRFPPERGMTRAVYTGPEPPPAASAYHHPPLGGVKRVVAVNQTQIADDIAVTILSLEFYEHGMLVHGRMRAIGDVPTFAGRNINLHPRVRVLVDPNAPYWFLTTHILSTDVDSVWFTARDHLRIVLGDGPFRLSVETEARPETNLPARRWEFDIPM